MAATDWTFLNDGLDVNTVDRGATAGVARPTGGGDFVYAFNSLLATDGAVGLFHNGTGFAPTAKGGRLSSAIVRLPSAGETGFSPFLFVGLQGNSVNDSGYMLGLSDENPSRIVLKKGALVNGLGVSSSTGVLRASDATFSPGTWVHLRLDVLLNENGDVVLNVYRSTANVTTPAWNAVPGMATYIDDALGINTGSQPYEAGRMGFAFQCSEVSRRAAFDYLEMFRQD